MKDKKKAEHRAKVATNLFKCSDEEILALQGVLDTSLAQARFNKEGERIVQSTFSWAQEAVDLCRFFCDLTELARICL